MLTLIFVKFILTLGGTAQQLKYSPASSVSSPPAQYPIIVLVFAGNLCYDFDHVTKFLNDKAVQKQLGVNKQWARCHGHVVLSAGVT